MWGSPDTTRDFLYVDDAAAALILLLRAPEALNLVNAASGDDRAMGTVAATIAGAAGFPGSITWDAGRPVGIPRRAVDISRLRTLPGADTAIGFEEGIRRTIDWHRTNCQ